jgi:hypothetical protein
MRLQASPHEAAVRETVIAAVLRAIRAGETIRLPEAEAPRTYEGAVGDYRYLFEGEEDLLHLVVERIDGGPCSPEEGQAVARFLMPDLPPGLCWLKPGEFSQHLYCGHDDLLRAAEPTG